MWKRAILLITVLSIPAFLFSDTIIVPDDYATIQEAIDSAVISDTVLVKPGTYVENIDFKGKAITVTGEEGAANTVIDGNQSGSVVCCFSGEGSSTVLDGFTITNGYASSGGGMSNYNSSPTVTNCTFSNNSANGEEMHGTPIGGNGGGMCNYESGPTVINCIFSGNWAVSDWMAKGGGMYNELSFPKVHNCTFMDNWVSGTYFGGVGGGMFNRYGTLMVTKCIFIGNDGCGLHSYSCNLTVTNCGFFSNSGSGMIIVLSNPIVTNCVFSQNTANNGGAINDSSSATIVNCILFENSAVEKGGAIYNSGSDSTIVNTIIWNNVAPQGSEVYVGNSWFPSNINISHSDVKGGHPSCAVETGSTINWGQGMIDSDPLFVDPANGDYHLTFNSPCRGSGDNTAVTALYDFEGDPRICQCTVDIGADECYRHLYCMGDFTPGGSIEGKFVGLPGTTPVGLFIGSGILSSPLPAMWGDYWLQAPYVLLGPLGSIPSNGVMVLPTTLPGSIPAPYDIPVQALIGLNADSLTNLCILEVR